MFIGILFSCFSNSEGKQGQNEKYQNSRIHYLNADYGDVHENKHNLNGHHNLKHVMKFKKNRLKKVQNTIRIAIDFIINGKPFKVSSKRSKMLTEMKSKTKQLDSSKTEGHTPSHLPKAKSVLRRLGTKPQVTPKLEEITEWKSMVHTNENQVEMSETKSEAGSEVLILKMKAKENAITKPSELEMNKVLMEEPSDKKESEGHITYIDENMDVTEQPTISELIVYEKELGLDLSDKLKQKTGKTKGLIKGKKLNKETLRQSKINMLRVHDSISKLPTEETTDMIKEATIPEADIEEDNKITTMTTL